MAKFQPGQSGNPGGRPKGAGDIREVARRFGEEALATLVDVATNAEAPAAARVTAAMALLDRGFGKPLAQVQVHKSPLEDLSADQLAILIEALQDDAE